MAKRTKRVMSTLICKNCGLKMMIPRPEMHIRAEGHIKTMWCAGCKDKTDFIENNMRTYADVMGEN